MRRPLLHAALLLVAGASALAAGPAGAADPAPATGPEIAAAAAAGDLGVLLGREARRRLEAGTILTIEMSPTLGNGDAVVLDRAAYRGAAPARGDVVVHRLRPDQAEDCDSGAERIARVVGVPGDAVRLDGTGVVVNGQPLAVAGAGMPDRTRTFPVVPPGRVLVLGDNRRYACDSASWRTPFVAVRAIRGRIEGVFWPRHHAGVLLASGGVERRAAGGPLPARVDAYMELRRGYAATTVAFLGAVVCEDEPGDCDGRGRGALGDEIRRVRARLRAAADTLGDDCGAAPVRRVLARLGRDHRAVGAGVSLDRLATRLDHHFLTGLSGLRACWRVGGGTRPEAAVR